VAIIVRRIIYEGRRFAVEIGEAWPYRRHTDSDTSFNHWSQDGEEVKNTITGSILDRFIHGASLYRYIIVVGLPVIVLLLLLARILRAVPGLSFIGSWIESIATSTLGGGLGDVVIYANEPGEAAWIRGAIVADIRNLHRRADVRHIHVFAHSQGTPITFETLFNHLPPSLRRKIKTYVTIGSVLNYFAQANGVLDIRVIRRFPRLPYPHSDFADGFQWINFWNHGDPIPEFSALDPYEEVIKPPTGRSPASPTNIRTRGALTPWGSHSEYWTNVDQVHKPLVRRVFFGVQVDGGPTNGPVSDDAESRERKRAGILSRWLVAIAIIVSLGVLWMATLYSAEPLKNNPFDRLFAEVQVAAQDIRDLVQGRNAAEATDVPKEDAAGTSQLFKQESVFGNESVVLPVLWIIFFGWCFGSILGGAPA
jgi:hypothetical protein